MGKKVFSLGRPLVETVVRKVRNLLGPTVPDTRTKIGRFCWSVASLLFAAQGGGGANEMV